LFVANCTGNQATSRPEKGAENGVETVGEDGVETVVEDGVETVVEKDTETGANAGAARDPDKVGPPPSELAKSVSLRRIQRGLSKPLALEFFEDDPLARLFVVEQTGTIRAIQDGVVSKTALLDIRSKISTRHNEQGLLGLAFHPKYKDNRRFYVNYTDRSGATRVVEYTASAGAEAKALDSSAVELLKVGQPWGNHNGGGIEFGPDGLLYVGMGDGGAANDPKQAGQDPDTHLGKMLRIDVETKKVEVIQSGLRNPWRYSFDRKTGDLYIGDVGQNKWEEIHVVAAKDIEGANFGWSIWEGRHCFRKNKCVGTTKMISPAIEFGHDTGCSVTGGVVYRGKALPALDGAYFYSDFCTAILRSFRWKDGRVRDHWDWKTALDPRFRLAEVSSFAEDADGEIYVISSTGSIYKIEPTSK
jgi:glucose/arabinose dehydrogenase